MEDPQVIPIQTNALPEALQPSPTESVTETIDQTEEIVEDVSTVADKILEDTQWLREKYQEVNARLQALMDSQTQSRETSTEIQSLRQELRNLKEALQAMQTDLKPSAPSISSTVETVETVSPIDEPEGEEDHPVAETRQNKRRKI